MQALECVHSDKPFDETDFLCKSKQTLSDLNILKKALSVPHFILWWCVLQQCMVFSICCFFSLIHLNSVAVITLTLRFWNTGTHRWQTQGSHQTSQVERSTGSREGGICTIVSGWAGFRPGGPLMPKRRVIWGKKVAGQNWGWGLQDLRLRF